MSMYLLHLEKQLYIRLQFYVNFKYFKIIIKVIPGEIVDAVLLVVVFNLKKEPEELERRLEEINNGKKDKLDDT